MQFPFSVFQTQVEDHIFWIAKSSSLNGCVGQGETQAEAIHELEENETEWILTAKEIGIPIPAVPVEDVQEYSGKLTLRISPAVHRKASMLAKKEGISLNQYINDAIVSRNSELTTAGYISKRIIDIVNQVSGHFFKYETTSNSEAVLEFPMAPKCFYNSVAMMS
jgi:predicted HicB family RNase H-like nuclease|nr:type II toxin-antitoxin system HicB family antitoxin [uncultured Oscillibacter sp.]DAZ27207.1 MAG TPA: HicB family [Caudoviricetes sp.]